jgi:outer membrane immunogenic protein
VRNSNLIVSATVAVGAIFGIGAASAADLPARTYTKAPAVVATAYNWTGFYVGVNAGYSWGSTNQVMTVQPGGTYIVGSTALVSATGTSGLKPRGAEVGGQIGYNYQVSPLWVVGVESDLSWNGISETRQVSAQYVPGGFMFPAAFFLNQRVSSDWFLTVRGRAGITPMDRVLLYVTGGLAVANLRYSSAFSDNTGLGGTEAVSLSSTKAGWTVGGGIEGAITSDWTAKAEYLHSQFSGVSGTGFINVPFGTNVINHSTGDLKIDTVRVGLNYHFNAAPLVAKY